MNDCPPRLRTGLSSFTTCTHDKYNHSRLYGQSLDLNLHGPNPRIMMAREHRKDKEGGMICPGLGMEVALFLPV
jgi:hypothetical protein